MELISPQRTTVSGRFSKQELFEELVGFMPALASSFERLFGEGTTVLTASGAPGWARLRTTPMWQTLSDLYDFAHYGVRPAKYGDGSFVDVELFVGGLGGLEEYLAEDETRPPRLALRTLLLAQGREILDGGEPYSDLVPGRPEGYLSCEQVALLGDVSEDRVQREVGCSSDRRFVGVPDARRWLASRAAFVPTDAQATAPRVEFAPALSVQLPADVLRALQERAVATGRSAVRVLREFLRTEIDRDPIYGIERAELVDAQAAFGNDQTQGSEEIMISIQPVLEPPGPQFDPAPAGHDSLVQRSGAPVRVDAPAAICDPVDDLAQRLADLLGRVCR